VIAEKESRGEELTALEEVIKSNPLAKITTTLGKGGVIVKEKIVRLEDLYGDNKQVTVGSDQDQLQNSELKFKDDATSHEIAARIKLEATRREESLSDATIQRMAKRMEKGKSRSIRLDDLFGKKAKSPSGSEEVQFLKDISAQNERTYQLIDINDKLSKGNLSPLERQNLTSKRSRLLGEFNKNKEKISQAMNGNSHLKNLL
jgi:hypothetical protein